MQEAKALLESTGYRFATVYGKGAEECHAVLHAVLEVRSDPLT